MLGALRPMCVYVFADASLLAYAIGKCNEKQWRECRAASRQRNQGTLTLIPHRKGRVWDVSSPDRSSAVYLRRLIPHGDHDRKCDLGWLTTRQALATNDAQPGGVCAKSRPAAHDPAGRGA
jgi:hypothetical protein